MVRRSVAIAAVIAFGQAALAQIRITEWMYQGAGGLGEYYEFTNTGVLSINMTGWSFDDNSRVPGSSDLSAFGVVLPGESVVLTESTAAAFRTEWSLPLSIDVIGGNTQNLGRSDELNIYDNTNALVDRLTYGDQVFSGSIRTQNKSGNPISPAALGANDPLQWRLAVVGDQYGSYTSASGDIGNPGRVPEPAAALLLIVGGLLVRRR